MSKINAIIVDDHDLFRTMLRTVLETGHPDIAVVGDAKYGADFFRLLETVPADIVLLDIDFKFGMTGIEIARRLKKEYPAMKIIAVSSEDTMDTVREMLEIGIEGFISKSQGSIDNIADAVYDVMQGFPYYGKDIAGIISRIYVAKKNTTEVTSEFTEQEKRIILLCLEGFSAKMVAERLNITSRTVETHKSNIFRKLDINSTTELLNYLLKSGFIRIN
jgi:DNA-binding NarL/FixJ family response regulator